MSTFLGIDIGTFESKGVLVSDQGQVLAQAARPHRMLVPQPGWAEHRPQQDWWDDLAAISRELLDKTRVPPAEVKGVGVSAIGPCMLPVDADGHALMNAVLYGVDTRAVAEIEELTRRIGTEALLRECGVTLTTQSVGPKILWLRRHRPEIFARTAKVVNSSTYLVQRLTGECVIDHYSAAGFAPLYDIARREWSDALAPDIIPLDRLPRPVPTMAIAGGVTAAAAAETGLAAGTPVIAGTIDAAAEAFSIGVHEPGDLMLMYGSTIFAILVSRAPIRDARLWYVPWIIEGLHASAAGLATSGTLTHWFRDQIGRDLPHDQAMPLLAQEAAAAPPGAEGLVVLPYFSGERTPIHDPRAKGVIFGLNLTHTRAHLFRAFLEGIAFGVRHLMVPYAEAGEPPRRVVAVGGGTKNAVWLQAVSDIGGIAQSLPRVTFGASLGDAMLAAIATGAATLEQVRGWNPEAGMARPDPALKPLYDAQFGIWRGLYDRTKELMARLPVAGSS
ncbi:MAG TPA: FGGY family carbohydrate kinase [Acetobacteraceae bacterium]|nr:FGGY family carbohydrate kinase [Acetobacteraceae bacterium]